MKIELYISLINKRAHIVSYIRTLIWHGFNLVIFIFVLYYESNLPYIGWLISYKSI